jgi:hypothetical protein
MVALGQLEHQIVRQAQSRKGVFGPESPALMSFQLMSTAKEIPL